MRSDQLLRIVSHHYTPTDLQEAIIRGLASEGRDPGALTLEDLSPVDEFHTGGNGATRELARRAGLRPGMRVLDVGGGLGGPARTLAAEFGCEVVVLDITEEYCRVGAELTRWLGLSSQVSFKQGSALEIPFAPESFDVVWTQHSSMNIPDKEQLYREISRVVVNGGRLAFHEILWGPGGSVHLPVPWARQSEASHLIEPSALRALLVRLGFHELVWEDETAAAKNWFRERLARSGGGATSLGLHLLLGGESQAMFRNLLRNLDEDRVGVVQGVYVRP